MSKSEFDAFVKRQQIEQQEAAQQEVAFDSKQQLNEWLDYLDALYTQITTYLRTYIDSAAAQIDYRDLTMNEEFIGPYTARQMILKIGRATVTFTPIGTMLIGMKGRVEVQGPSGRAPLFLVNKLATSAGSLIHVTVSWPGQPPPPPPSAQGQIEWVWKIGTPPPEMKFIELTQEAFFEMVLEVANA